MQKLKMLQISFLVILVAASIGILSFLYQSRLCTSRFQLKFLLIDYTHSNQNTSLRTIKRVLSYLGLETAYEHNEEWDVMWSNDYPFELFPEKLVGLKPHQVINHFPAITFLTNKM